MVEKKLKPVIIINNHYLRNNRKFAVAGFSLVELMIVVSLVAILSAVAVPSYKSYIEKTKITEAAVIINAIAFAIDDFRLTNNVYPSDLSEVGYGGRLDPWGTTYKYLWIEGNPAGSVNGKRRKNRWDNPVNTDFDLYSNGPDLNSQTQFTAKKARDDIVRAYNGTYVGSVSDL